VDGSGNVFIADAGNFCVRKVTAAGMITTVAGNQNAGFSGDGGLATQATMSSPSSVAVGVDGSLYIADFGNARIRKVTPNGIISTIAGNGIQGTAGDGGPAIKASLWGPQQIALDAAGNVYVADQLNSAVRKISPAGVMTTVAGTLGSGGYSGDGGPATKARLGYPSGVAVDSAGNLYIADASSDVIREVNAATGNISTIAGTGQAGFSGDGGPALAATFSNPKNVAVDSSGNVFLVDGDSNRIRRVSSGTVSTYPGTTLLVGDGGTSTSARLSNPSAVAVDSAVNLHCGPGSQSRAKGYAVRYNFNGCRNRPDGRNGR
jgi:trimeric autotransporter adhesin